MCMRYRHLKFGMAFDIVDDPLSDQDRARYAHRLYPGSQIYAISVDIAFCKHNVSDVNADAKGNRWSFLQLLLNGFGRMHGFNCRVKYSQAAITAKFEHFPLVGLGLRFHDFTEAMDASEAFLLIALHHACVAHDVGKHNGCESAFSVCGHGAG